MNTGTPTLKPDQLTERWFIIDAKERILGRLATQAAVLLRSKDQPTFSPHQAGDTHVVVINAAGVRVTGAKLEQKKYYRHGGRPGSLKERTLAEQLERDPTKPIETAIRKMLPDNKLRAVWMNRLHVYPSDEHPHQAQKPQEVAHG